MAFLHVMQQITLLLCHTSSILKSRSFGTLICVLISFWILSFYSRIVQGFSPLHFGEPPRITLGFWAFKIYSSSIVPGGLDVRSYMTLLTPFTSLIILFMHICKTDQGISAASAVMKSEVITPLKTTA